MSRAARAGRRAFGEPLILTRGDLAGLVWSCAPQAPDVRRAPPAAGEGAGRGLRRRLAGEAVAARPGRDARPARAARPRPGPRSGPAAAEAGLRVGPAPRPDHAARNPRQ